MQLHRAGSGEIDADLDIGEVTDDGRFDVTIESAGGSAPGGRRRNPDYSTLLEELLRRTSAMDATIEDAVVSSREVKDLSRDQRRIQIEGRPFPFKPDMNEDFAALRKSFTRPQGNIGSSREHGGGNQRKRITISFRARTPIERADLIRQLGLRHSAASPRKVGVASGLTSAQITSALAQWKELGRDEFLRQYGAPVARRYVLVDEDEADIDALALILGARALAGMRVDGPWHADRANVANPLRQMGYVVLDLDWPHEAPLGDDPSNYVDLAARLGGTDVAVRRMGRREQRFLRGALGIGSGDPAATASCGMCGRLLPQSLLVAAHIKPRRDCSDAERVDMPHVGWALCLLGCDSLFEQGYLGVDHAGQLRALREISSSTPSLREFVDSMDGSTAPGWTAERRRYFESHRTRHASRT